jgi:5-methyltetrahydrofolate--homocysteine methyltransferase
LTPGRIGRATDPELGRELVEPLHAGPPPPGRSFLIVGERCNASGSPQVQAAARGGGLGLDRLLAREQVRDGSHVLDVNVDYAGATTPADMAEIVKRFSGRSTRR